ncbi:MAG TPA: VOC family protein [Methylomirabilota bacterium]|nr:VOC family protein [Methylomirabilota bacterium]
MGIELKGMAPLLQVFDMPTAIAFYCGTLGFELVANSPVVKNPEGEFFHWALLRHQGIELMLNTAYDEGQRPPAPDPKRIAAHDDTCLYFGAPDVDAVYDHLRGKGLDLKPPTIAPYGMKQLYLHDPDGYNLCFQWAASKPETSAARS